MKKNLIIAICAALVAMMVFTGCTTAQNAEDFCQISVEGESTVKVAPDIVNFSIRVSEKAPTTAEAQQLANEKISSILKVLAEYSIEKKDITTSNLNFSTDYSWNEGKQEFVAERVSQQVSVLMRDIDSFPKLLDSLTSKLTGIELNSVNFDREDKAEYYKQARAQAIADAKSKAEAYAVASGLVLGDPISISEGSAYISTNRISYNKVMMASAAPEADSVSSEVPSGELEISASISVVYKAQ